MSLSLVGRTAAERTAVAASSTHSSAHAAALCIDGSLSTFCATRESTIGSNWVAVRVPSGTRVGAVAMYNARDDAGLP